MVYQNIIIGSGPTGLVAANEILEQGKSVKILDIGKDIEGDNLQLKKDFLHHQNKKLFLNQIKKNKNVKNKYKNEHLKFPFGSDYVFRKNDFEKFNSSKNIDFVLSAAKGGLSNIWGTMVSPFYEKDIENWDIKYDEFYSNLNDIKKIVPILSSKDNLENFFKIKFGKEHSFKLSSNSEDFYQNLNKRSKQLNEKGIYYGRAKLAVGNFYSHKNFECQECGLCHYGCPYDCMFSANNLFNKIKNLKNFEYTNNTYVDKIEKKEDFIEIFTINTATNDKTIYKTKNIFICCGPISTAALMLRSGLTQEKTLKFKESQRFFIPVFKKKNQPNSIDQNKNTLSEIFVEIFNKSLCEKSIHIQYYSFLNVMLKPLEKFFGDYAYLFPQIAPFLFGRLNLLIGYLHSDYSNKISIIQKNENNFYLDEIKNEKNKQLLENIIKFLSVNFKKDFFFIKSLLNKNLTGASYHYGSSLPMTSDSRQRDKTSLLGELNHFNNIFILDASILPDMPGSPTTLNVCINAQRIIKELSKENRI